KLSVDDVPKPSATTRRCAFAVVSVHIDSAGDIAAAGLLGPLVRILGIGLLLATFGGLVLLGHVGQLATFGGLVQIGFVLVARVFLAGEFRHATPPTRDHQRSSGTSQPSGLAEEVTDAELPSCRPAVRHFDGISKLWSRGDVGSPAVGLACAKARGTVPVEGISGPPATDAPH